MIGIGLSITKSRSGGGGGGNSGPSAAQIAAIVSAANGAFYEPSDLSSLYVSRLGGANAASGDVVGVMLDKSKMAGQTAASFISAQSEKVTNGGFSADVSWTKGTGWTIAGGVASHTGGFSTIEPTSALTITADTLYLLSYQVVTAGTSVQPRIGGTNGIQRTTPGAYQEFIRAGGTGNLQIFGDGACSIDNVSVKEVPGFHAVAPTDSSRPLLTVASGLTYLEPDGVDDWFNVFPTLNLGEAWWSVGAYYNETSNNRFPFATSDGDGSLRLTFDNKLTWMNNASTYTLIASTSPVGQYVATVEQASTTSISGRQNGAVGTGGTITPANDSATTQGLAIFTRRNGVYSVGLAGRFYGSAFGAGAITTPDRATVEAFMAAKSGVAL